ncbi:MAG: alpha/beta fold hydrolase, partial [Tepidisphaeraceae bacterium]
MTNPLPLILMLSLAGIAVYLIAATLLALLLLKPPRMTDGKAIYLLGRLTPADLGFTFQPVSFNVRDHATGRPLKVAAWWIPAGAPSDRCVVLLHGRADAKVGAIAWAPMLRNLGWNILVPDMRAHGESDGRFSTAGVHERYDVDQVINQIQAQFPQQTRTLVLVGLSMGAGIALGVAGIRTDIAGLVLDSPFCSYAQATWEHMKLMAFDIRPLHRAAIAIAERLAGCRFDDMIPVKLLAEVSCPVLLIDGDDDPLIPPAGREQLQQALATRSGRGLCTHRWSAPGTGHLQAYVCHPQEYERRISEFLETALRSLPGRPA